MYISVHAWVVGDYDGDCDDRCGMYEYTQTRTVECQNQDGVVVDAALCTEDMPETERTCPGTAACMVGNIVYINSGK